MSSKRLAICVFCGIALFMISIFVACAFYTLEITKKNNQPDLEKSGNYKALSIYSRSGGTFVTAEKVDDKTRVGIMIWDDSYNHLIPEKDEVWEVSCNKRGIYKFIKPVESKQNVVSQ